MFEDVSGAALGKVIDPPVDGLQYFRHLRIVHRRLRLHHGRHDRVHLGQRIDDAGDGVGQRLVVVIQPSELAGQDGCVLRQRRMDGLQRVRLSRRFMNGCRQDSFLSRLAVDRAPFRPAWRRAKTTEALPAPASPKTQLLDDDKNLPEHRAPVKDFFPIDLVFLHLLFNAPSWLVISAQFRQIEP
ncbi:MAG TPA: hypothetical protein PKE65_02725 [Rhizobiaceae bacterium]|nr:hypothetical protein [Rhizobiaceae bacterium]